MAAMSEGVGLIDCAVSLVQRRVVNSELELQTFDQKRVVDGVERGG